MNTSFVSLLRSRLRSRCKSLIQSGHENGPTQQNERQRVGGRHTRKGRMGARETDGGTDTHHRPLETFDTLVEVHPQFEPRAKPQVLRRGRRLPRPGTTTDMGGRNGSASAAPERSSTKQTRKREREREFTMASLAPGEEEGPFLTPHERAFLTPAVPLRTPAKKEGSVSFSLTGVFSVMKTQTTLCSVLQEKIFFL
jgi:hypothetical protein